MYEFTKRLTYFFQRFQFAKKLPVFFFCVLSLFSFAQEAPPDSAGIVPDTTNISNPVENAEPASPALQPDTVTNTPNETGEPETPNLPDTTSAPAPDVSADTTVNTPLPTYNLQDTSTITAIADTAVADTTPPPKPPKKIIAEFDTLPLIIKEGDVISKVLRIINGTDKEHTISVNITYPGGWKTLTNTEREYSIEPEDTFYIPIRIVPQGKVLGNTKYLIYAYVINSNKTPVASAHFLAEKQKLIKWDMNVSPDAKLYLMNDDNEVDFSINVFNSGNEKIELMLDMSNFRKDRLALMDTSGKILKRPVFTFELPQLEDTTFMFRTRYIQGMRNFRLIDTENYRPGSKGEPMKYSIFAQSKESALQGKGNFFKGKKIDLIRLPDETTVNPFGKPSLPLIMDINFANILGSQPIMNAMFRGRTTLNNGAMLNYYVQSYFSSYFLSSQALTNTFFNIGYFTQKYNVQIGNVGGGMGGGGRGIMGNYQISNKHSIGAFFSRGPRLFNANNTSFGINHNIAFYKVSLQSSYSHVSSIKNNMDYFRSFVSMQVLPKHTIGAGIILIRFDSKDSAFTRLSYGYNVNYSGNFMNGRLQSSVGASYMPVNYFGSSTSSSSSLTLNHASNFQASKSTRMQLTNQYSLRDSASSQPRQELYTNQLSISSSKIKIAPNIFYNIVHFDTLRFHSRGLGIGYSLFDYETNRMVGVNIRGGYNKIINLPDIPDYFFLQTFLVFRYRVWSGNLRYTYGSVSSTDMSFLRNAYPQSVGMGLNNQYQFANPHFVLQSNFTYNYINTLRRHSFGLTPQLYYYTYSGWRFYVTPGYYVSVGRRVRSRFSQNNSEEKENEMSFNQSVIINAGVRKEFGIPIPWMKTKYPTLVFRAFIDHDGNSKQDAGEVALENVVVKLGEWEMLTNEKGIATVHNVFADSTYSLGVFSLIDLNGYFPNIPLFLTPSKDSSYSVPFVKGVKVHGSVYLDRDKIIPGVEKPLDLSGIKITALNGKSVSTLTGGKGEFSFYIPFGKYTITMDEKVLGDRFSLLQNNIELDLDQKTESIFLTFYIVEKRRKITVKKFNGNGDRLKDADTTITPKTKTLEEFKKEEELKKQKEGLSPQTPDKKGKTDKTGKDDKKSKTGSQTEPVDKSQIKFKVQIGAYNAEVPNEIIDKIKALPNVQQSRTEEGLTRYTAGEFNDYESAQMLRQEIINTSGVSLDTLFVIIIADYKGKVLSADEAKELLKD